MDESIELAANEDTKLVWGILGGLLVGSLAGAVAMLLFAPQSGRKTRAKIQKKGIKLSEQTTGAVDDVMAQTRHKARKIQASVRHQAEAIQERGQDVLDKQKEHLSNLAEAGNTAIQDALS